MVRGHAKAEAQARNAKKNAGKEKGSNLDAIKQSVRAVCPICKAPTSTIKVLQDHYASKHPKETVPADNLGLTK